MVVVKTVCRLHRSESQHLDKMAIQLQKNRLLLLRRSTGCYYRSRRDCKDSHKPLGKGQWIIYINLYFSNSRLWTPTINQTVSSSTSFRLCKDSISKTSHQACSSLAHWTCSMPWISSMLSSIVVNRMVDRTTITVWLIRQSLTEWKTGWELLNKNWISREIKK